MNIWFRPMRSRLAARGYFRPAVVTIRDSPQNGGGKTRTELIPTRIRGRSCSLRARSPIDARPPGAPITISPGVAPTSPRGCLALGPQSRPAEIRVLNMLGYFQHVASMLRLMLDHAVDDYPLDALNLVRHRNLEVVRQNVGHEANVSGGIIAPHLLRRFSARAQLNVAYPRPRPTLEPGMASTPAGLATRTRLRWEALWIGTRPVKRLSILVLGAGQAPPPLSGQAPTPGGAGFCQGPARNTGQKKACVPGRTADRVRQTVS
jgi:hypothetical protein